MNKFFVILIFAIFAFTISAMEKAETNREDFSEEYIREYERVYKEAKDIKDGKGYNGRKPSNAFGESPEGQLYTYETNQLYIYVKGLAEGLLQAREDAFADIHFYRQNKFKKTDQ